MKRKQIQTDKYVEAQSADLDTQPGNMPSPSSIIPTKGGIGDSEQEIAERFGKGKKKKKIKKKPHHG